MPTAPTPEEIYERSIDEGRRRLSMSALDKVATGFIAGVTIVFGILALGIVYSLVEPELGPGIADVAGGLAFAIGLVFLVVGRSELFTENFFGPVAATVVNPQRSSWLSLGRLWIVILVLNLVGGIVMAAIASVPGALPDGAPEALAMIADEIASKAVTATFARAIAAGALLTLLSYMLHGCDSTTSRIKITYMVGFFVAVGPFDHVVVSALHLLFGIWLGGTVTYVDVLENLGISTVGNLLGGLLLITLTHTAQVRSETG
ncbi:MAG TPA: formate/nitrite transporter family protein [Actinomycetota bacterium]|nr:formate/nitrite transporter family protein [Actinomycetota bacterium]